MKYVANEIKGKPQKKRITNIRYPEILQVSSQNGTNSNLKITSKSIWMIEKCHWVSIPKNGGFDLKLITKKPCSVGNILI